MNKLKSLFKGVGVVYAVISFLATNPIYNMEFYNKILRNNQYINVVYDGGDENCIKLSGKGVIVLDGGLDQFIDTTCEGTPYLEDEYRYEE